MATVPETISFCWPSTNASIPSGWERTTAFDGKHVFWTAGDDAATTGGAATHTHSVTRAAHSVSAGASNFPARYNAIATKPSAASNNHTHAAKNSATGSYTSGATSNNPPWISLIFINPADASQTGVPNNAWALVDDSVPTSWTEPTDADNKFVKGATVSGDADLTGGGSADHNHSLNHSHSAVTSNIASSGTFSSSGPDYNWFANYFHTHNVSLNSASVTSQDATNGSLPLYEKLLWVKNSTGGADVPVGIIGFYLGAEASIPANWERVDPTTGDFIMGATQASEIGDTGGNATHTHTGTSHTHTASATSASTCFGQTDYGTNFYNASCGHHHTWSVTSATDTVSANSSKSHYPEWVKAILLKFTGATQSIRLLSATGAGI